jgi:heme/copper-type cytochrome/quinol oxidase subunit 1
MLSAKLFATLAILQLGLAFLGSKTAPQSTDIHLHATYFVFRGIHLQIFLALASACFALTYFAASRWVFHPLNSSLGFAHFAMATIGFVLISAFLFTPKSAASANGLLLAVGLLCFLLGCATLAVNCTWTTTIAVFRSH